eukprot:TRINITY_DN2227_c0_g1_i1.p2 TRINITY_DN2227_c0_g1~~TRINITY_DN2227_c0_g1_i1.p2  ORF type:complete len:122 (-),score=42.95 TRINITY_DN2227_c0_g1_i1:153-518(-)
MFAEEVDALKYAKTPQTKMKILLAIILAMIDDGDPFFTHDTECYAEEIPIGFEGLFEEMEELLEMPAKKLKIEEEELKRLKMRISELGNCFREGDEGIGSYDLLHSEWPHFGFDGYDVGLL